MSMITTTSKLASLWRFSITVCSLAPASLVTGHYSPATRHYLQVHWPLSTGHCYDATRHDLPAVRQTSGIGLRRPTPAGYCLSQSAGFPMNSLGPGVGRGPLVGHWSGWRWHNSPPPRFVIGNSLRRRFLQRAAPSRHLTAG